MDFNARVHPGNAAANITSLFYSPPKRRLNSQFNELLERVGNIPKFPQNDFTVNTF